MPKFTAEELERYDRARILEQDARGALSLAERVGVEKGLRRAIRALCEAFGIEIDAERAAVLESLGAPELEALQKRLLAERAWS